MRLLGGAILFGLIGLIVTPIVVALTVLLLAHIFDPRCGTPGDSGGCEMGAASIGFFSAVPGMVAGILLALLQAWRHRKPRS